MSFVTYHAKHPATGNPDDVSAFQLDAVGCDGLKHPNAAPLLLESGGIVWAAEGAEVGQFGEAKKPVGFDPKTGAPVYDYKQLPPIGYDPKTGAPIYQTAADEGKA